MSSAFDTSPEVEIPPGEDELPYDFGPPMESNAHADNGRDLVRALRRHFAGMRDVAVEGNMAIYFNELQVKKNDFLGPDVFVVLDSVPRSRKSWVVWQEGQTPDVVIEIVSDRTRSNDYGDKKQIYARTLRVPEYYLYDPATGRLDAFVLDAAAGVYHPAERDGDGGFTSRTLGLRLVVVRERYQTDEDAPWLRWADLDGRPLPSADEEVDAARSEAEAARSEAASARNEAETARTEAETARAEAETARARAAALAAKLRELGVDLGE